MSRAGTNAITNKINGSAIQGSNIVEVHTYYAVNEDLLPTIDLHKLVISMGRVALRLMLQEEIDDIARERIKAYLDGQ